MNRRDRRALHRTLLLGAALVVLVAVLDLASALDPLENALSDRRMRWFQHFMPAPTDQLVHVDIDDPSLELIGKWPWSREKFAAIVAELQAASVKAAAFDVIFPEASDGDADERFAAALGKFGKGIIPVSFAFQPPPQRLTSSESVALELLTSNPTLSAAQISDALSKRGEPTLEGQAYIRLLRQSVALWVKGQLAVGAPSLEILESRLAGAGSGRVTVASHLLEKEYARQLGLRGLENLGRPATPGMPRLPEVETIVPPVAALTNAAGHTAFVDDLLTQDCIRAMPVLARMQGKVYCELGLALALNYLGVDPARMVVDEKSISFPGPAGAIRVPIYTKRTPRGSIGSFIDIPWFGRPGNDNWTTAYDFPAHAQIRQHLSISNLYDPILTRQRIAHDNAQIDNAIAFVMNVFANDKAPGERYMTTRPAEDDAASRMKYVSDLLPRSVEALGGDPATVDTHDLAETEKLFVNATQALQAYQVEVPALQRQMLDQEKSLREQLAGKAVLIGWTASGAADIRVTPLWDETPGVLVHGAVFNSILSGYLLHRAPWWINLVLTLMVGSVAAVLSSYLQPAKSIAANALLLSLLIVCNCVIAFDWRHWIFGLAAPAVLCVLLPASLSVARFMVERAERARLRRRFSSYMDPALLTYIEANDIERLEGQVRIVSVVFTDLMGFTTLTEMLQERTVGVLNEYLHLMTGIIRGHKGFVNKFLGDGIMFFYGAPHDNPTHAIDAVSTVLSMQEAMASFNDKLAKRQLPPIGMRAGITSGEVIAGDAGGDLACDYTVLGDRVNLAARLESANKQFGTRTLITDQTAALLQDRFLLRPIGIINVKGKTQAVKTYEPLGEKSGASDANIHLADATAAMVDSFIDGEFEKSLAAADILETAFGPTPLIDVYRENARAHLQHRPVDFCGAIVLTQK